mgnify:CR=1 FL=1
MSVDGAGLLWSRVLRIKFICFVEAFSFAVTADWRSLVARLLHIRVVSSCLLVRVNILPSKIEGKLNQFEQTWMAVLLFLRESGRRCSSTHSHGVRQRFGWELRVVSVHIIIPVVLILWVVVARHVFDFITVRAFERWGTVFVISPFLNGGLIFLLFYWVAVI